MNIKTPNTEYIKNTKPNKAPTFIKEGNENNSVSISFYNPCIDFTSFKSLVTLKTRIIRASYGPTLRKEILFPIEFNTRSITLESTINKSNLFQEDYKYPLMPIAIILRINSIIKTAVKNKLIYSNIKS